MAEITRAATTLKGVLIDDKACFYLSQSSHSIPGRLAELRGGLIESMDAHYTSCFLISSVKFPSKTADTSPRILTEKSADMETSSSPPGI